MKIIKTRDPNTFEGETRHASNVQQDPKYFLAPECSSIDDSQHMLSDRESRPFNILMCYLIKASEKKAIHHHQQSENFKLAGFRINKTLHK